MCFIASIFLMVPNVSHYPFRTISYQAFCIQQNTPTGRVEADLTLASGRKLMNSMSNAPQLVVGELGKEFFLPVEMCYCFFSIKETGISQKGN